MMLTDLDRRLLTAFLHEWDLGPTALGLPGRWEPVRELLARLSGAEMTAVPSLPSEAASLHRGVSGATPPPHQPTSTRSDARDTPASVANEPCSTDPVGQRPTATPPLRYLRWL